MKKGLKGITDATVFCKSMKKGGTTPMIRSMKSYDVGGATGLSMANTNTSESSSQSNMSADPPRWFKRLKRSIKKVKNQMEYNRSKSSPSKPSKPGHNKAREQQNSKNHRCTGKIGCI